MPSLQQVNLAIMRLREIEKVLQQSRDTIGTFERKDEKCKGKPPEYEQGYTDGLNAGIAMMNIDFDRIDAVALVEAFTKEPDEQ